MRSGVDRSSVHGFDISKILEQVAAKLAAQLAELQSRLSADCLRYLLVGQAQMIVLSVLKFASFSYANLVRGKLCFFSSFFGFFLKKFRKLLQSIPTSDNYLTFAADLPQFRQNSVKFEAKMINLRKFWNLNCKFYEKISKIAKMFDAFLLKF